MEAGLHAEMFHIQSSRVDFVFGRLPKHYFKKDYCGRHSSELKAYTVCWMFVT